MKKKREERDIKPVVYALYRDVIARPTSDHILICSAINMRCSGQRIPCSETVPTNFPSTCCASVISPSKGLAVSTARSMRTWPLTEARDIYLILKAPNIVPYEAILYVACATAKMVSSTDGRYITASPQYVECSTR